MTKFIILIVSLLLMMPPVLVHNDVIVYDDCGGDSHIILSEKHKEYYHKKDCTEDSDTSHHHHCSIELISVIAVGLWQKILVPIDFKILQTSINFYQTPFSSLHLDGVFQPPKLA